MVDQDRITIDSRIRSGKPCIKGTRIAVADVLDYLGPRLDAALAELNCTQKPSGKVLAETLLRAAADFYRLDADPADAETMRQLGGKSEGNPLDCLISEKAIEPAEALTIGLAVLATLADLCRTAEASILVPG